MADAGTGGREGLLERHADGERIRHVHLSTDPNDLGSD